MNDEHIPELSEIERDRWEAVRAAITGLSQAVRDGVLDEESLRATQAQLAQVDLDMARVRDALHVPEDAGPCADGLTEILRRIPDGWGRWISCDAGWYPLIVGLHTQVAALAPGYQVHQVKEKFGGLRFYTYLSANEVEVQTAVDDLIRDAEHRSYTICERCGAPGSLAQRGGWYKTVCPGCAESLGFTVPPG